MAGRAVMGGLVAALVVLSALAGLLWINLSDLRVKYGVLSTEYSGLKGKYGELSGKYSALMSRFEGLESNYTSLISKYSALRGNYTSLLSRFKGLRDSYSRLQAEHEALIRNYTSLKNSYSELRVRYVKLNSTYVNLRKEYEGVKAELESLSKTYNSLLSNYSNLREEFMSLRSEYGDLQNRYLNLSNEYLALQGRYDDLLRRVEELMNTTEERAGMIDSFKPNFIDWQSSIVEEAVKEVNFNAYSDPYKAILEWVEKHITYNFDTPEAVVTSPNATYEWVDDYYQYAGETLRYGYGDCEDQAILTAAMVEAYWYVKYGETYLIWVVEAVVSYGGKYYGHDFVIIPFQGGQIAILDPTFGIYVPPTNTLAALQEYERLSGLHIAYVYGVFSPWKYYHVGASTLREFAEWLNTH